MAVLGACAGTAWLAVSKGMPWLSGAPRALALTVALTAVLIAVHLVPGALGLFLPGAVLACGVLLVGAVILRARRAGPGPVADPPRGRPPQPPDPRWSRALAGGTAALLAGCAVALLRDLAGAPITSIDAQNFQVPIVARWIQEDSLWGLHQFIADYSNATYPHNGNLLVSAVMLPFDSAFLARLVAAPYWVMAAVAVGAVAHELGAPRTTAVLAGSAFAAVPVMVRAGLEGVQTDAPMLACLAAGVLFLLRHHRTRERRELIVAGVALGLALGTKWYALTSVAGVLGLWLLARRRVWPDLPVVVGLVAVAGGFWLLRNLVETSNPLFPQPFGPFGAPEDPLRELGGFSLARYAFDLDVWQTYLRPAFATNFGWTGATLAAGAAAVAALRPRGPVLVVLLGTVLLALLYTVTPYSAFGPEGRPVLAGASTRYGLPALAGAAALCGWLGRTRARPAVEVLLVVAVADGIRRAFGDLSTAKMVGGAAFVAMAAFLAPRVRPRWILVPAMAAVGVAGVILVAGRAENASYGRFDPVLAALESEAPSRVALAGVWSPEGVSPVLAAFGSRLRNRVAFAGTFREGMLRSETSQTAFAQRLRGFDLLVVGRGAPPRQLVREETWAREAGWVPVTGSERLALLRAPRSP